MLTSLLDDAGHDRTKPVCEAVRLDQFARQRQRGRGGLRLSELGERRLREHPGRKHDCGGTPGAGNKRGEHDAFLSGGPFEDAHAVRSSDDGIVGVRFTSLLP